jgi:hypothetical protein
MEELKDPAIAGNHGTPFSGYHPEGKINSYVDATCA